MVNLVLFVVTAIAYWLVVASLTAFNESSSLWKGMRLLLSGKEGRKDSLQALGIIALLCLPLNINGHVFTVLGNVHSTGVKNVYSVFSLYQNAENNAYSLFGALYQKADKGNTFAVVGLLSNQIAGDNAVVFIGFTPYQKAGNNTAVGLGISLYQNASENADVMFGLNGGQYSKDSNIFLGGSVFQSARERSAIVLGVPLIQKSKNSSVGVGISLLQYGSESAENRFAMSIYQRAGNQSRAFAVWSKLTAE